MHRAPPSGATSEREKEGHKRKKLKVPESASSAKQSAPVAKRTKESDKSGIAWQDEIGGDKDRPVEPRKKGGAKKSKSGKVGKRKW